MLSKNGDALSVLLAFHRRLADVVTDPLEDLLPSEIAAQPLIEQFLLPELDANLNRVITLLSQECMNEEALRYFWDLIRSLERLGNENSRSTRLEAPPNLCAKLMSKLAELFDFKAIKRFRIANWAYSAVDDLSYALLESIPPEERVREGIKVLDAYVPEWSSLISQSSCEYAVDVDWQLLDSYQGSIMERDTITDGWFGLGHMGKLERRLWLWVRGLSTPIFPGEAPMAEKRAVCMLWWQEAEPRH